MKQDIKSVLKLEKLVFDKLLFERKGFLSKSDFQFALESKISQRENEDVYKVTLILRGTKNDEYAMEISLSGFFAFSSDASLSASAKKELISKNTVAILMPYLRSEVSILTAQPETECVVLPPFNINNLMSERQDPS